MIDWPTVIAGVTALVGAFGVRELIAGWSAKHTGAAQEEKARMQKLISENEKQDKDIEHLHTRLRRQKEYSSLLRGKLLERGVAYQDLPEWPKEGEEENA